jgi:D-serine deaminase-like pyridoxal phosphate-dependent protein
MQRLLTAGRQHGTDLRVVVDSRVGVEVLARGAREAGSTVGALLEIDVGLHRCGVREGDPELVEIVQVIRSCEALRFVGLLSHAGHAYAAADRRQVAEIAAVEVRILQRVRAKLESGGVRVDEVSIGSTPTVLASESYDGITEIRPGNYVFLDRTPVRLGLATIEQVALSVLTTVVSRNDQYLIVDAGSKVLTSDLGAHGSGGAGSYGVAFPVQESAADSNALNVVRLSEEHGFVEPAGREIPIGAKLRIVPNHACPVANLADELVVVSGGRVVDRWRVAARGKTR